ncbi:hypothetical protein SZN_35357 [Streptomyces zinciresistens K42]|uniref:Uncharacterized protein n=1 Tax=Streptomyces zinciresistens K42 TaxID=700597 RepID=G2GNG6_9ACTN|nr:hypothetical protein [Streptomyces zinciresistens]EGX54949.1 hypothetical protein SZN_35357 [Streptomyces zinciresistens K42]
MGDQFRTDIDQLAAFTKDLQGAQDSLDQVRTALQSVRADQIGTPELDEACDTFQERWKYGNEQIKARIGKLTEGLKQNTESYREVETSLEESFRRAAAAGK